ncbi:hypothetical protein [Desulfovibrio legallii]|jgi:hypothetical protein|uniref:hypothetical protein n=1 Tax=Desulfovibrio legallii TaxID=571438 RepID=UPI001178A6FF|nr:hypothetical protein [Desulfovibrio legallii]
MKASSFSDSQILAILKQAEAGFPPARVAQGLRRAVYFCSYAASPAALRYNASLQQRICLHMAARF